MILQTINGAISADYTIVVLFGVVGFLLITIGSLLSWSFIRTLKQIEVELKSISDRVDQTQEEHRLLEMEVIKIKAAMPDPDDFANKMIEKLRYGNFLRSL